MKRKLLVILSMLLVALVVVAPVSAITGNYVKDFEHPFVGLLVAYDESGEFIGRCSGSLLSEHVFLTAGHCVEGASTARVYFQQDAGVNYDPVTQNDPVTGYPDTCAAGTLGTLCATSDELYNYGYPAGFPNTQDAGLVILDQAIELGEYGVLAGAGTLDNLATRRGHQELTFTVSGYGLSAKNPVHVLSFRERLMATSKLVNLRSNLTDGYNLQTTNNPGGGRGGTCNGDSGGPFFYGNTTSNLIVAVNSFGLSAQTCQGVDFAYRTDRAEVLSWILSHVPAGDTVQVVGS